MTSLSRIGMRGSLILGICAAMLALPAAAQARVFVGIGLGFPPVYAPYYAPPPPVYYAPPPAYYAPPPPPVSYAPAPPVNYTPAPAGYGGTCYAGVYTCAAPANLPAGSQCSCPGIGAPSYGTVH